MLFKTAFKYLNCTLLLYKLFFNPLYYFPHILVDCTSLHLDCLYFTVAFRGFIAFYLSPGCLWPITTESFHHIKRSSFDSWFRATGGISHLYQKALIWRWEGGQVTGPIWGSWQLYLSSLERWSTEMEKLLHRCELILKVSWKTIFASLLLIEFSDRSKPHYLMVTLLTEEMTKGFQSCSKLVP